jgi:hypothetical protein
MASRKDRFGGLGAARDRASGPGQTADLFEHYGIAVAPAAVEAASEAISAGPCRRCGWYLALQREVTACPLCNEADPHAKPKAAKTTATR